MSHRGATERAHASSGSSGSVMQRKVPELGTLRAFAAAWILLSHIGSSWHLRILPSVLQRIVDAESMGVDLFLVLSGWLIGGIVLHELEETNTLDILRSWVPRWARTLPAYAITLALAAFASRGRWLHPWAHVAWAHDGSRFAWSWSLCIEQHFYLGFPLAVLAARTATPRLTSRAALRAVALVAVIASVMSRELAAHPAGLFAGGSMLDRTIHGATEPRLDGLAVGVVLASLPPMNLTKVWAVASVAASAALVGACVVSPRHNLHESLLLAVSFGLLAVAMTHDRAARALCLPSARGTAVLPCGIYQYSCASRWAAKYPTRARRLSHGQPAP
jgi:peptidoglycan/LPS O-acetylase OafA/YrhL